MLSVLNVELVILPQFVNLIYYLKHILVLLKILKVKLIYVEKLLKESLLTS